MAATDFINELLGRFGGGAGSDSSGRRVYTYRTSSREAGGFGGFEDIFGSGGLQDVPAADTEAAITPRKIPDKTGQPYTRSRVRADNFGVKTAAHPNFWDKNDTLARQF